MRFLTIILKTYTVTSIKRTLMIIPKTFEKFDKESINNSIINRFEYIASKYGEKIAVVGYKNRISYNLLNNSANIVSSELNKVENPNKRAYLLFEHDTEMIVGIIGILKSALAYIPLDPAHPVSRLKYIISDSKGSVLVTNKKNLSLAKSLVQESGRIEIINVDELDFTKKCLNSNRSIDPYQIGYILYTSGSTGKPKGVIQNHRNILHFIRNYTNNLYISPDDRLTLFSTYSFDAAVMDIFGSLLNGSTLYPYGIKNAGAIDNLSNWIKEEKITIFHSVPTLFRYFISRITKDEVIKDVRLVVMGGEPVLINDIEQYKNHFSDKSIFINGLGPTESTVTLQYFINKQTQIFNATVPVGYPVDDTNVYLLDQNDCEVRDGEVGELVYKSDHLALGYLNLDEKTNQVFITDPITKNGRVFKTGDLGKRQKNGPIEFLGRNDFQIKIRGYRIELNEIESILDKFEGIQKSVVMPTRHLSKDPQVIAYYTTISGKSVPESLLIKHVKSALPSYMVPTYFYHLDEMPLTATGKTDRMFIVDNFIPKSNGEQKQPKTNIEKKLMKIWKEVLNTDDFGIDTEFMKTGGNSLLTTTVALEMQDEFGISVALTDLVNLPTIEKLAHYVEQKKKKVLYEKSCFT